MDLSSLFSKYAFHPVIHLPPHYEVYDFSKNYDANRMRSSEYGIGKYSEKRVGMYTTELFTKDPAHLRDIHMGVDIAAPAGTPVHAFHEGIVLCSAINPAAGDYGGTVITEHHFDEVVLYVLHGHLSHASLTLSPAGKKFQRGEIIAHLGEHAENGGWNPHLHFQLSLEKPEICDMPGAVSDAKLEESLKKYPDPRLILGKIY